MSSEKEEQKTRAARATKAAGSKTEPDSKTGAKPEAKAADIKPSPAAAAKPSPATSPAPPPSSSQLAKQEPEPPAFEKGLAQELTSMFGDRLKIIYIKPARIKVETGPSDIVDVALHLRDNMGFDHAESASGTDYPKEKQIEVNYHLGSYTREDLLAHIVVLTTRANRDDPHVPSLIGIYPSVEYHERETYEMLGVYFEGHPRMERFLLPEDWADIPPLRKDFRIKGR